MQTHNNLLVSIHKMLFNNLRVLQS